MSRPKYKTSQNSRGKSRKKKNMVIGIFIVVLFFISIVASIILIAL